MNWHINNNELIFDNGEAVSFDFSIAQAKDVEGVIVVILGVPASEVMTENVFGISYEGKIIWQIERTPATATNPINSYIGLRKGGTGKVILHNWNEVATVVDTKTGRITDSWVERYR
jgi:hypothetical protein